MDSRNTAHFNGRMHMLLQRTKRFFINLLGTSGMLGSFSSASGNGCMVTACDYPAHAPRYLLSPGGLKLGALKLGALICQES